MNQVQEEEFFIRLSKDKENMMRHQKLQERNNKWKSYQWYLTCDFDNNA